MQKQAIGPSGDPAVRPPSVDQRVAELDATVGRLTSEVTALKLELATLVSALKETQAHRHTSLRSAAPIVGERIELPSRPSPAPAAIVVLIAVSLLSWQLIAVPRPNRDSHAPANRLAQTRTTPPEAPKPSVPIESPATEPPVTPLVTPTVYKGSLAITAAQPQSRVFVNRRDVGIAPVRLNNLKAGAHLVWIEREGYRRWTRVVTVPAQRVTRVSATLEPLDQPAFDP